MDKFKFGNNICRLREEKNLTQAELAKLVDVSDKAVSKWENGQTFPRMDTLEKIAQVLDTSAEQMLAAGKENAIRVCFINNYSSVMHLSIDGRLFSLGENEKKWIETESSSFYVCISGDFIFSDFSDGSNELNRLKDRLAIKFFNKVADKLLDVIVRTDCTYQISGVCDGAVISVNFAGFSLGDKALIYQEFLISYPKITLSAGSCTLVKAVCKNTKEIVRQYKKLGLISDIGLDFLDIILLYPIRGLYFSYLCKPHILKKNILNYEAHKDEPIKPKKKRHYFLMLLGLLFLGFLWTVFVQPMIFIEKEMPALISSDYTSIVFMDETYEKIEKLPADAVEEKILGVERWYGARLDGLSRYEQSISGDKVKAYTDTKGNKYLWLVRDYLDSIHDEKGENKDYTDFENPEVYICRTPK